MPAPARSTSASPRRRSFTPITTASICRTGGLLAATHNLEEMRDIIGADSLAFLSIDGMYRAMGEPGRDPSNPKFADHCFTGVYPTHLTDQAQVEPQPRQLSLLAEAS